MKIELHKIKIKDIFEGYRNNNEEGVVGFSGKLNIRPKYQREFVYDDRKRNAVIDTVRKGFPLNVMYWVKNSDGTFEVLDGQQRTISICEYLNNKFSILDEGNRRKFFNLTDFEKGQIENYELMIYFCEGNEKEKLDWFKIINIAGEKLTDQELRNAVYTGEWLTHAKSIFSKNNCKAWNLAKDYLNGSPIRQDYLEIALDWISNGEIEKYMSENQNKQNANELWLYFQNVISWVKMTFINYRKEMKGVNWGELYNRFSRENFDTTEIENRIVELLKDDEVTKKSGIYRYILTGEERWLSLRAFTENQKREAYEQQNGICSLCGKYFKLEEMHADHIVPWSKGGKTVIENCQMLCTQDNIKKSNN